MLRQLTSSQLTELEAFWVVEGGWGENKQDWRTAQISSVMANAFRSRDSRPASAKDFVLQPDYMEESQQDKQQLVRHGLSQLAGLRPKGGRGARPKEKIRADAKKRKAAKDKVRARLQGVNDAERR
jgi:hypothetical protein